jgi:Phosphodiester glycosidase
VKPTIRRFALPVTALAFLVAASAILPAAARDRAGEERGPRRPIIRTRQIAPGVLYTRIVERRIPRRTFVLSIDVSRDATVDVALAESAMPARRRTSDIAKAADAIAATNGDFSVQNVGRPVHPLLQDGDLVQTAAQEGPMFGIRRDESGVVVGRPDVFVSATDRDTGQTWRLDAWNHGAAQPGEIVGFSPLGGTLELAPRFACSVRLLPDGEPSPEGDGFISDFVVDQSACTNESMDRMGGVVLSAAPATDEATQLLAMTPGTRIRLRWSLGWENVFDAVGGMPVLVQDGQIVAETCSSSFCRRNPRTAIGWTANGRVLLVVVDGRRPRWSVGASLGEMGRIMQELGAVQALNLDGGGSSVMWVEGDVVNKPSDGQQRQVTNAMLVLPGPDPGEA